MIDDTFSERRRQQLLDERTEREPDAFYWDLLK